MVSASDHGFFDDTTDEETTPFSFTNGMGRLKYKESKESSYGTRSSKRIVSFTSYSELYKRLKKAGSDSDGNVVRRSTPSRHTAWSPGHLFSSPLRFMANVRGQGQGQGQQGSQGTQHDDDRSTREDDMGRGEDTGTTRRGGSGNFAEDPGRASEAGRKGGQSRGR